MTFIILGNISVNFHEIVEARGEMVLCLTDIVNFYKAGKKSMLDNSKEKK